MPFWGGFTRGGGAEGFTGYEALNRVVGYGWTAVRGQRST